MGVFDFFRRKPVLVEEPTIEQNVLVEETNEENSENEDMEELELPEENEEI